MPITFNDFSTMTNVYRKDNNIFSANYAGSSTFDYFENNPTLHDAIYFSYYPFNASGGSGMWKDVQVQIGTPRTNAGSGVWEYCTQVLSFGTGSVDTTNDRISYAGHPFNTGDILEYQSGTTAIGGMTANGTYFARKIDSGYFTLHPTLEDANNNTNKINFTSQGSGTHKLIRYSDFTPYITWDATAGFTASAGSRTLSFNPPDDWFGSSILPYSGNSTFWLRYRLTDVAGITEGGANATTSVKGGTYAYRISGFSSGSPATLSDIYTQDQIDDRNLVTRYNSGILYMMNCNLEFGDSITDSYFNDANKTLIIEGHIYLNQRAYVTLGTKTANNAVNGHFNLIPKVFKTTKFARNFAVNNLYGGAGSSIKLYGLNVQGGSYFQISSLNSALPGEIIGCNFVNTALMLGGYQIIERVFIGGNSDGFRFLSGMLGGYTPNDVCVHTGNGISINWISSSVNVRNAVLKDCSTYNHNWQGSGTVTGQILGVYDATGFDISKITYSVSRTYVNCFCREFYSLNYTVLDKQNKPIQGATVTATNGFGTFTGTTDINGNISLDVKVKEMEISTRIVTNYSTVSITLSATGFETIKDTQVLNKKMVDVCCLQHSPFSSADEMGSLWV